MPGEKEAVGCAGREGARVLPADGERSVSEFQVTFALDAGGGDASVAAIASGAAAGTNTTTTASTSD